MSTTIPNSGWVGPPNSENRWRNGYPQKGKSANFFYILHSSGSRPVGAHQYYTSSGAPGCAHKISTDVRLMLPPFLQRGKMSQILAQITTQIVFGPPYF